MAQALVMSGTSMVGLVGALIGYELAPTLSLSTLPIVAVVLGNALNIAPCIWLIKKLGRKQASLVGVGLTVASGVLASFALANQSFALFVASQWLFGMSISFVNQYRFAAAESVEKQDVPKAVSWILIGGLFAAQALASLVAGFMVYSLSWAQLNMVIGILFVLVSITYTALLVSFRT